MSAASPIRHPLLAALGVVHGFGVRGAPEPPRVVRPKQVHGAQVAVLRPGARLSHDEADAVVSVDPAVPVAVVTADCVPILLSDERGAAVAAVHAGWRGLAQGVVEAGARALAREAGGRARLRAVIGPCIGACCYEVDAPVVAPLERRFGAAAQAALEPVRAGHHRLDLAALVRLDLERAGLAPEHVAALGACTRCDGERFHSYRRDGPRAGRLLHYVIAVGAGSSPPEP